MENNKKQQADLIVNLNNEIAMEFQLIPAGEFTMGSRGFYTEEEPRHRVKITKPFFLGRYPVTQAEFAVWTSSQNITHENEFPDRSRNPAENMAWHQAMAFCDWLTSRISDHSELLDSNYSGHTVDRLVATLPTEAQWEYACRARTTTEYYSGDGEAALDQVGWFIQNSESRTHEVGEVESEVKNLGNDFGLYDMHGNVEEWCLDQYDANAYRNRVADVADPVVTDRPDDTNRVLRGGCWFNSAVGCRSAYRIRGLPGLRFRFIGFRVCLVPDPAAQSVKQTG